MILPKKHLTLYESIIGLSTFVLTQLESQPLSVDELWMKYKKINYTKRFPAKHNFDNLILALDILYSLKKIKVDEEGKLKNEAS
ncbi:MAG: ABC-three component system middle component 6 [Candidatus Nanoarchaeia archaeon]